MRLIVFTGKGGAGVSTLAAATAAAIAAGGRRTLAFGVSSGLADAFERDLGAQPLPLAPDLWGMEAGGASHEGPDPFLAWLRELFVWRNMDETIADDIAALPGLVDVARLLQLEEQLSGGRFDAIVVDGPALRHALDLLAALDAAARALNRLFPERQPTVLDPFVRAFVGPAASGEDVYEGGRELLLRLSNLRHALSDPEQASVRIVLAGDRPSLSAARRAVTALSLFAYPLDAAFCNRLLPADAGDWPAPRRDSEQAAFQQAADSLQPLPVLPVSLRPGDAVGLPHLSALAAEAYAGSDAAAVLHRAPAQAFSRSDGRYVLSLALPFVDRDELAIERLDDALIVYVGDRSRTFDLPADVEALQGVSSGFDGETLRVTFGPAR